MSAAAATKLETIGIDTPPGRSMFGKFVVVHATGKLFLTDTDGWDSQPENAFIGSQHEALIKAMNHVGSKVTPLSHYLAA